MKIAILHTSLDVSGGAERQVLMLSKGLQSKGHEVIIYVSKLDKKACYPDLIKKMKVIECGGFGYKDMKKSIVFSPFYMNKMAKKIKDCDIINCHNFPTIYAAISVIKKKKIPIIWMCNEPPFPPLYDGGKISKSIYSLMYKSLIFPFIIYNKMIIKKINKIIVLDNMNYSRILKTYKIIPKIIHTGLDFKKLIWVRNNNQFQILALGRIDKGKRTEDAIKAINILKKNIPNIKLNIVGDGKKIDIMKKLSNKLKLNKYIEFYGRVSDKELNKLQLMCNISLFTAENQSWGLVPLEAMTYKKPCIVSTGAGVSNVLTHKKNCLKIKPRDVNGIVKNIFLLYQNNKLLEKIAKEGYSFVKNEFSWTKYVEDMEKIFLSYNLNKRN
jgi:glycosyltransferase involved in cell wall biosynthesis